MRRGVRYVLVFLTILVGAAGILILTVFVQPNVLKSPIEQWVKANSQRVLAIGGDIQIVYLHSRIYIHVNDLTLSEYRQETLFAAIERARLMLSLWPLLHQRVVVDDFAIEGLRARLIRDQNGRMNIEDLLAPSEEALPFVVEIARTGTTDSNIVFHDAITQRRIEFNRLNVITGRITAESVDAIELKIPLIKIGTVVLESSDVDANKKADKILAMQLAVEQFALNNTGIMSGVATLSLQDITTDSDLNLHLSVYDVNQSEQADVPLSYGHLNAALIAQHGALALEIALDTALTVEQAGNRWEFDDFKTEFTVFHPEFVRAPVRGHFDGNLSLDVSAELLQTKLEGVLADSRTGVAARIQDFASPDITVDIDLDTLDLNALRPEIDLNKIPAETKALPEFSFLNNLNLNGSIMIGLLSIEGVRFSGIQFMMNPESRRNSTLNESAH